MGRHQVVSDLKYFKIKFKPICLNFTNFQNYIFEFLDPKNGGILIFTSFLSIETKEKQKTTKLLMRDTVKHLIFK